MLIRGGILLLLFCTTIAAQEPPRIRGRVLKVQGDLATLDVGRDQGVRERSVFEVYTDARAVRLPMTGETVYVPQKVVAELVVVSLEGKTADARILPPVAGGAAPKVEPNALAVSNPLATPRNIAPHLRSIAADPPKTSFGNPVAVRVECSDEADDLVVFEWTATGGALSHARSAVPEVVWLPPLVASKPQPFKVTVVAVDGAGNRSSATVDVEAGPPEAARKAVYTPRRRLADHKEAFAVARDLAFDEANACYLIDSYNVRLVGRDAAWNAILRTDDYKQPVKELGRLVVRGGDAWFTDLYARRAVRMRVGPKMYQDPPAVSYGSEGTGNGQFQDPVDIALDARGEVHVLDQARGCVQIFDREGAFLGSIGSLGEKPGQMQKPVALDIARDGTLYVLDEGRKRVLVYRDGRLAGEWEAGAKADTLADLKVDPTTARPWVLCISGGLPRLRSFAPDGTRTERTFGAGEEPVMGVLARPSRIRFDRLGSLYIIARDGAVIHRCDPAAGEEVARWGGIDLSGAKDIAAGRGGELAVLLPKRYVVATLDRRGWIAGLCGSEGTGPGKLAAPVAVAVDAGGNVCVLDQKQACIQVFRPRGEPLRTIGRKGDGRGDLKYPIDLEIDPGRRWLAVLEDRNAWEVKVYDLQAKPGEELKAAFPADEDAVDDAVRVAISPSGLVHVAIEGGQVKSFNAEPALSGPQAVIDGANAFFASSWRIEGIEAPGSLAISNLLLLFAADPSKETVRVLDLGRRGALVTEIKDPKAIGEPAAATVDDFDRVYVWDADNGRAVELGR